MSSLLSIGSSGMQAAQTRLTASASNVANMNTPGFRRVEVSQTAAQDGAGVTTRVQRSTQEGVAPEQEAVEQIAATYAFKASLQVVRAQDQMMGSLLDVKA